MPPASRPALLSWRCPACTHRTVRPFTTTIPSRRVGPEHPRWIDVPKPVQKDAPEKFRIRGSLPVPRDIFDRRRGGVEKVTPAYLDAMTSNRQKPKSAPPQSLKAEVQTEAARQEWKGRMSDIRKKNLRQGLRELQERRRRSDAQRAHRANEEKRLLREAIERPQREDERLTSPSVTQLLQRRKQPGFRIPDPNRAERIAAMGARVQQMQEARKAARMSALQELYMNARSFIVSEDQLNEAIETQFGTPNKPARFGFKGTSIWNTKEPESVMDKMNREKPGAPSEEIASYDYKLAERRMKKIAKELTSGAV